MAFLFLRGTRDIRVAPLLKSAGAALASGGALWAAAGLVLTGAEGKALLVAKCLGLGAAAMAVYAALMLLMRQEDLMEMIGRYRK